MTINNINKKLNKFNEKKYRQFKFCLILAIVIVTSLATMIYSPIMEEIFPIGGDSRKQIYMVLYITLMSCIVFVIYALSLFLRQKSEEIGIFLALGAKKKKLYKKLSKEIKEIVTKMLILGFIIGIILTYIMYNIFKQFIVNGEKYDFSISINAVTIILVFIGIVSSSMIIITRKYIKKSNVLDFLYGDKKTETSKKIDIGYGISGPVLIVLGIILGYITPQVIANILGRMLPSIWNITYVISIIGIYRLIAYIVMGKKGKKDKLKYYKHIIPYNMMLFQGKQTVRSINIMILMVMSGIFAFFYIATSQSNLGAVKNIKIDISIPTKEKEKIISKKYIYNESKENDIKISGYRELYFSELLGSGVERDWSESGKLIENYQKKYRYSEFISEDQFEKTIGKPIKIKKGEYLIIVSPEESQNIWEKYNDLDFITNSTTGKNMNVKYGGKLKIEELVGNGTNRYVLNNNDFKNISKGLSKDMLVKQTMLSISGTRENKYNFSKNVYEEILKNSPKTVALNATYDKHQKEKAIKEGKKYGYDYRLDLNSKNNALIAEWKYYPKMKPILKEEMNRNKMGFLVIFSYGGMVCIAAALVIGYTRALTITYNNKKMFEDLKKLGARKGYLLICLKEQIRKIYILSFSLGSIFILLFLIVMLSASDGKFSKNDLNTMFINVIIILLIYIASYIVYKLSVIKSRKILDI